MPNQKDRPSGRFVVYSWLVYTKYMNNTNQTQSPVLTEKAFNQEVATLEGEKMTLNGVISKSAILLALVIASGITSWTFAHHAYGIIVLFASIIVGLILALIIIWKKHTAPVLAPIYAIVEGCVLGIISRIFESQYEGIVVQAVLVTVSIFVGMLFAYKFKLIRVTQRFAKVIIFATAGIAIYYVLNLVFMFFGGDLPLINSNSIYGILFTLFVAGIAALNLILDFDFIERSVEQGFVKYMEWYASFGLLVTLVWLYIEVLRLISKIRGRR